MVPVQSSAPQNVAVRIPRAHISSELEYHSVPMLRASTLMSGLAAPQSNVSAHENTSAMRLEISHLEGNVESMASKYNTMFRMIHSLNKDIKLLLAHLGVRKR